MLTEVNMIIFAIQAAIKLGQKMRTVFEEEVRDRPLLLPPVGHRPVNLPDWNETENFFNGDGKAFVAPLPHLPSREQTQLQPSAGMLEEKPQPIGMLHKLWEEKQKPAIQDELAYAYQKIKEEIDPHRQEIDVKIDYRRGKDARKIFTRAPTPWF